MRIRFGLHLDGQRGSQPRAALGEITVGPSGFLNILETHQGLLRLHASQSERIVQYRDCLRQCDEQERFFHRTFATDELGTSATLLGWRDAWYLNGWSGKAQPGASARIRDLGDVETLAAEYVAPSIGQRLTCVIDAMQNRQTPIDRVLLLDPMEAFPKRWQELLSLLPIEVVGNLEEGPGGPTVSWRVAGCPARGAIRGIPSEVAVALRRIRDCCSG